MRGIAIIASAVLFTAAAEAVAQSPAGPEFTVNTAPTASSNPPSVAMDGAGNFVVAWSSGREAPTSVRARRFDARGVPQGDEIVVASVPDAVAATTRVASDPGGAFVVVWDTVSFSLMDSDVFARRFSAAGEPLGEAFRVNSVTSGIQAGPAVAADAAGNFVVVWGTSAAAPALVRLSGRRFSAAGTPIGIEFDLHPGATVSAYVPRVGSDAAGNFVATWQENDQVLFQRFSASATPVGGAVMVTGRRGLAEVPTVSVQPDGGFVVAWEEARREPPHIVARRYSASGSPLGEDIVVRKLNTDFALSTLVELSTPSAAGFTVAWANPGADADKTAIEARHYSADGRAAGPPFVVNTTETGDQTSPALAADAAGNVVAVWNSRAPLGEPDVYGQRFGRLGASALSVDTAKGGNSHRNGVLENREIVDVRPSWRNNSGVERDLEGTLVQLEGPEGPSYAVLDGAASYGSVPDGEARTCTDCYRIGIAADVRPSVHWDVVATELIGDPDNMVRWRLHVGGSFADVPRTSPFYRSVETLLHRGVTAGCAADAFCPTAPVTREQMAGFLLAAAETLPVHLVPCLAGGRRRFSDVPETNPFCAWIEEMARRGISGCGPDTFCPHDPVTRELMAVLVLRTLDPALDPPACTTSVFSDVPASSPFCRWVEELARRGITAGCGGGRFCGGAVVTREQMAVFLTTAFGLTLYGP